MKSRIAFRMIQIPSTKKLQPAGQRHPHIAGTCNREANCRYGPWEVGGGRATRQPGQVRKEAALTSTERVTVPASRLPPTSASPSRLTARCRTGDTRDAPSESTGAGEGAEESY